jgi:hypothetical protein
MGFRSFLFLCVIYLGIFCCKGSLFSLEFLTKFIPYAICYDLKFSLEDESIFAYTTDNKSFRITKFHDSNSSFE